MTTPLPQRTATVTGYTPVRPGDHGARDCHGEPLAAGDIAQTLGIRRWVLITEVVGTMVRVDNGALIWGMCLRKDGVERGDL